MPPEKGQNAIQVRAALGVSTEGKINIPGICSGFAVGAGVRYESSYAACGCPKECPVAEQPSGLGVTQTLGEKAVTQSTKRGSSASLQAGLKLPVLSASRFKKNQEGEKGGLAQSGKGNKIGRRRLSSPAIASIL